MVGQYPLELPAVHASGGEFWQVLDAEPPDQLHHLGDVTGLLADLSDHGLAWGVQRIGEPAGSDHRPSATSRIISSRSPSSIRAGSQMCDCRLEAGRPGERTQIQ